MVKRDPPFIRGARHVHRLCEFKDDLDRDWVSWCEGGKFDGRKTERVRVSLVAMVREARALELILRIHKRSKA